MICGHADSFFLFLHVHQAVHDLAQARLAGLSPEGRRGRANYCCAPSFDGKAFTRKNSCSSCLTAGPLFRLTVLEIRLRNGDSYMQPCFQTQEGVELCTHRAMAQCTKAFLGYV